MSILRVTDETTASELEEALTNLSRSAKRLPHVVAKVESDKPTDWDVAHGRINAVIDDWRQAQRVS